MVLQFRTKSRFVTIWEGFGSHLERFLGTWSDIVVVWKGSGTTVKFQWISGPPQEPPKSGAGQGWRVNSWFLRPTNSYSRSLICCLQLLNYLQLTIADFNCLTADCNSCSLSPRPSKEGPADYTSRISFTSNDSYTSRDCLMLGS